MNPSKFPNNRNTIKAIVKFQTAAHFIIERRGHRTRVKFKSRKGRLFIFRALNILNSNTWCDVSCYFISDANGLLSAKCDRNTKYLLLRPNIYSQTATDGPTCGKT